jgi:hypothetical protein
LGEEAQSNLFEVESDEAVAGALEPGVGKSVLVAAGWRLRCSVDSEGCLQIEIGSKLSNSVHADAKADKAPTMGRTNGSRWAKQAHPVTGIHALSAR